MMLSDKEILLRLFKPSARLDVTLDRYGKLVTILDEPKQPDSSITIVNLPHDCVVVNVDRFDGSAHVFNCDTGICKRADYALISESTKSVLYIELKSSLSYLRKDIVHQFVGAQCFIYYCKQVAGRFWGNHGFMDDYCERFVSIVEISSSQRPIFEGEAGATHGSPDTFMKIKCPNRQFLHFNKLLGRRS